MAHATPSGVSLTSSSAPRPHTGRVAERLAPLTRADPVTSHPDHISMTGRWVRRGAVIAVLLLGLIAGTVATAHFLSIERRAHEVRATSLVPLGMPAKVLVVVARPEQELAMAGALAALEEAGTEVSMLVMTTDPSATSPAPVGGRTPKASATSAPAALPVPEPLARANAQLGVESTGMAGFPRGDLLLADPNAVTGRITQAIEATRPSALVTVSDGTGRDRDSQAVAGYALAAASNADSGVGRVWTVTRGSWERDLQALAGDSVDQQVPVPQVAVQLTDSTARAKSEVAETWLGGSADQTRATYPLLGTVPASLYFRFWDREYFALAWGTPVS